MRCSIAYARPLSVPALAGLLSAALTGCDPLTPNGTSDTMALLRSGSEKVCIAPAVQSTLKGIILPKVENVTDDATPEDKLAAISMIKISFELTTLQQYDKDVAKATCQSTVVMTGVGNGPVKGQVEYQVAPAAESPGSFIVSAISDQAQTYAKMMVTGALNETAARRSQEQADVQNAQAAAEQAQQQAQVRGVVKERWLRGVWILNDAGAATCGTSSAVRFQDGHVFTGGLGDGRWALSGTEVHLIGRREGQEIDERYSFSSADAFSGTASVDDSDAGFDLRRCTPADMHTTPEAGDSVQVVNDQ